MNYCFLVFVMIDCILKEWLCKSKMMYHYYYAKMHHSSSNYFFNFDTFHGEVVQFAWNDCKQIGKLVA